MKKNILIVVLIILSGLFLVYSRIKASEAEKQAVIAMENAQKIEEYKQIAEQAQQQAEQAAAEAMRQAQLAAQALEDCENNK